jgi:hypothetical protein
MGSDDSRITFLNCPGSSDSVPAPADAAIPTPMEEPAIAPASPMAPPRTANAVGSNAISHSFLRFCFDKRRSSLQLEGTVFSAATLVELEEKLHKTQSEGVNKTGDAAEGGIDYVASNQDYRC